MKIHPLIVSAGLTVIVGLQAWMLIQITSLSKDVAGLTAKVELLAAGPQHIARQ